MPVKSVVADRRAFLSGLGLAGLAALTPAPAAWARARGAGWPRVAALLDRYVGAHKIAGASVAIRRGVATHTISKGALAFDGALADDRTLWRIFSMSKPITGVTALTLVEDGRLRLNQPVADFVPEFGALKVLDNGVLRPARAPMLVSHLLTHTSGLGYAINAGSPLAKLYVDATLLPGDPTPRDSAPRSLDEFGARLATMPLGSDPGARWEYSVALDLMGLVIQRASGMPFETYLKARLFDPLAMVDTGFVVTRPNAARLSKNYSVRDGAVTPLEPAGRSPYLAAPAYPSGGGGLLSTAHDYDRFCAMLLGEGAFDGVRVLAPATARLAHSNLLPAGVFVEGGMAFGAGMGIVTTASTQPGEEPPGSFGWAGAAGTMMWIDPSRRLSGVLMTQYMPSNAYPLWAEIKRAVYADLAA